LFRDLIGPAIALPDKNGAGWSVTGGQQGRGITPCHDRRGMVKASPAASCTSESAIMHRGGQGERGQDRGGSARQARPRQGARRGGGGDGTAHGTPHTATPPHGSTPQPSAGRGGALGKIPHLKNFVGKCKRENALSALCIAMRPSVYATGVCV